MRMFLFSVFTCLILANSLLLGIPSLNKVEFINSSETLLALMLNTMFIVKIYYRLDLSKFNKVLRKHFKLTHQQSDLFLI